MWKEVFWALFKYYLFICLEGLREGAKTSVKITRHLSFESMHCRM